MAARGWGGDGRAGNAELPFWRLGRKGTAVLTASQKMAFTEGAALFGGSWKMPGRRSSERHASLEGGRERGA